MILIIQIDGNLPNGQYIPIQQSEAVRSIVEKNFSRYHPNNKNKRKKEPKIPRQSLVGIGLRWEHATLVYARISFLVVSRKELFKHRSNWLR